MKNIKNAKLKLTTESVRILVQSDLSVVNGGSLGPGGSDACPTINLCLTHKTC